MQGLIALLQRRGLPKTARTKIVRHKHGDDRYPVEDLIAKGHFEEGYQAYQGRANFECDYIISCIGLRGSRARFFGVYRVAARRPAQEVPLPRNLKYLEDLYPEWIRPGSVWYDFRKAGRF